MLPIIITRSGTACLTLDQASAVVLFDAMAGPRRNAIRDRIRGQRVSLPDPWAIAATPGGTSGAPAAPARGVA